ncbi:MAG: glycosyltransferase family A protein [Polynucleobacter sp.]
MEKIHIYLLCRDRTIFLKECVNSLLDQNYKNYKIIISDNSKTSNVWNFFQKNYPSLDYIKRNNLDPIQHIRDILDEAKSEYLVMFHDDDVLYSGYLKHMLNKIKLDEEIGAIGCNANVIFNQHHSKISFASEIKKDVRIECPGDIFRNYMDIDKRYHVAFPSYMYRTKKLKNIRPNIKEGGKNADVSFLMEISKVAPILWVAEKLMGYRIHDGNGRNGVNIAERRSLLNYVINNTELTKKDRSVVLYRSIYLMKIISNSKKINIYNSKRISIIIKYLYTSLKSMPLKLIILQLIKKIKRIMKIG